MNDDELAVTYITSICKTQKPPYSDKYIDTVRRYKEITCLTVSNDCIRDEIGYDFVRYANKLLHSIMDLPEEVMIIGQTFGAVESIEKLVKEINTKIKPYHGCFLNFDLQNEVIQAYLGYLCGIARAAEFRLYGNPDSDKLTQSIFLKLIEDNLSNDKNGVFDFVSSFDSDLSENATSIEILGKLPIFNMFDKFGYIDGVTFFNKRVRVRIGLYKLADFFDLRYPGRVLSGRLLQELGVMDS